jgi:type VI protein secretion system component VasK
MKVATRWSLIVGGASAVCLASVAMFLVYPVRRLEPGILWLVAALSFTPVFCLVALVVALVNSASARGESERQSAVRKAETRSEAARTREQAMTMEMR